MPESKKIEFDGIELYRLADSLLTSINIDKRHLATWKEYQSKADTHFKPGEITSSINLYTRLVNENITLRHKILINYAKRQTQESSACFAILCGRY
ncbi:hypothetical protein C8N40_11174 [Pontibacter mucosus]|uniref:Uncharacterized protein n=1 Tax=Pontibacter mucosus TaxID=1649266 RepID=A0A2T5YD16_9BACT|nr:hypothetical protein C8N40_11174 [Pontibacter mucosus]